MNNIYVRNWAFPTSAFLVGFSPEHLRLLVGSFLLLLEILQISFHSFHLLLLAFKFHCQGFYPVDVNKIIRIVCTNNPPPALVSAFCAGLRHSKHPQNHPPRCSSPLTFTLGTFLCSTSLFFRHSHPNVNKHIFNTALSAAQHLLP